MVYISWLLYFRDYYLHLCVCVHVYGHVLVSIYSIRPADSLM